MIEASRSFARVTGAL